MDHKIVLSDALQCMPLISFSNGMIRDECKKDISVEIFQDNLSVSNGNKRHKIMVAETEQRFYQSEIAGTTKESVHHRSQYCVAQVDKSTGSMLLYPTEMYLLRPMMQGSPYTSSLHTESLSFREKTDLLMDAFGSGKQKRALKKRRSNKMSLSSVTQAVGSAVNSDALAECLTTPESAVQQTSSAIPPCNLNALQASEVYRLHDIVGLAELDSLTGPAHVFCKCTLEDCQRWSDEGEYFPSVLSRLRQLLNTEQDHRLENACLLLYLWYMMILYLTKYEQMRRKHLLPDGWPDACKMLLLRRFTVMSDAAKPGRSIPARLKDLLLSHILVVCLFLGNFSTVLTDLQKDLKLSVRKVKSHAMALGCRVKEIGSSNDATSTVKVTNYIATLTVPLKFPQPRRVRKMTR